MRHAVAAALCALALLVAGPAAAEWSENDVKKVQEKVRQGNQVDENGAAPVRQLVQFRVGDGDALTYTIDLRAQLCFARRVSSGGYAKQLTSVPCANLKRGYPLFAPLITWEP